MHVASVAPARSQASPFSVLRAELGRVGEELSRPAARRGGTSSCARHFHNVFTFSAFLQHYIVQKYHKDNELAFTKCNLTILIKQLLFETTLVPHVCTPFTYLRSCFWTSKIIKIIFRINFFIEGKCCFCITFSTTKNR